MKDECLATKYVNIWMEKSGITGEWFISDVFGTSMLVGEKKPTNKQIEEYRKDRIEVLKKALSETRD
jgi:hypothetical protein